MKKAQAILLIMTTLLVFMSGISQLSFAEKGDSIEMLLKNNKILIVYFSHTGNTREIANQIHNRVGGDIFEIKTVVPYISDYDALTKQARKELDSDFRPKLQSQVQNIDSYDVIFIGYPIWWGTFPMAVKTFLSEHDLAGKTIIPFCTHEGSGLGRSVSDLKTLCKNSTLLEEIAVRGSTVKTAQGKVSEWLSKINMIDK